jgi:hypothetical protein
MGTPLFQTFLAFFATQVNFLVDVLWVLPIAGQLFPGTGEAARAGADVTNIEKSKSAVMNFLDILPP